MDKIYLKNIKIYAYHGCMEEEKKIGSNYLVNLIVHADLSMSCKSDELKDTVDYVALLDIVKNQMKMRVQPFGKCCRQSCKQNNFQIPFC